MICAKAERILISNAFCPLQQGLGATDLFFRNIMGQHYPGNLRTEAEIPQKRLDHRAVPMAYNGNRERNDTLDFRHP
jgi:hypothetical protein